MVSPEIRAKGDVYLSSDKIVIHGMFLLNEKTTTVEKDTMWGGSKTNHYYSRNDRPFPATIEGRNIHIEGKEAHLNAKIKGEKLYDLSEKGVHLFFVVGYNSESANRQFSNFATQGFEGFSKTTEKFLRADLRELKAIYRP